MKIERNNIDKWELLLKVLGEKVPETGNFTGH